MNIEKIKQLASWGDLLAVQELITQLEETKADLAHANSILIKVEKLLEGVEYRGDYAEGVRVLKDSLEVAKKDAEEYHQVAENHIHENESLREQVAQQAAKVRKETINEVYDTAFANFARSNVLEAIRKMAEKKP